MIYSIAFPSKGKTPPSFVTFSRDYRAWAWSSVGFDTVMSSIVRLATEKTNSDRKKPNTHKKYPRQNNEKAGRGRQKGRSIYQWGGNNAPTGRVSMRDFSMHTLQWESGDPSGKMALSIGVSCEKSTRFFLIVSQLFADNERRSQTRRSKCR